MSVSVLAVIDSAQAGTGLAQAAIDAIETASVIASVIASETATGLGNESGIGSGIVSDLVIATAPQLAVALPAPAPRLQGRQGLQARLRSWMQQRPTPPRLIQRPHLLFLRLTGRMRRLSLLLRDHRTQLLLHQQLNLPVLQENQAPVLAAGRVRPQAMPQEQIALATLTLLGLDQDQLMRRRARLRLAMQRQRARAKARVPIRTPSCATGGTGSETGSAGTVTAAIEVLVMVAGT